MAPDREQRADARASVERSLSAAPDVLAKDPYASLQRVAEASGVHRATVYRHFTSRERLISHLYEAWPADVSGIDATRDRIKGQLAGLLALGHDQGVFRGDMSVEELGTAWGAPIQYLASLIVGGSRTLGEAVDFNLRLVRSPQ